MPWRGAGPDAGFLLDLRNAEIRFTIRRIEWHAPRRYAVMTSVAGFVDGVQVFTSSHTFDTGTNLEFAFTLPDSAAYSNLSGPVDNITGATLSVKAMTRMAKAALLMHQHTPQATTTFATAR